MGTVYRARDRLTGSDVALKRVHVGHREPPAEPARPARNVEETLPPDSALSALDVRIATPRSSVPFTQDPTRMRLAAAGPLALPDRVSDTLSSLHQAPLSLALAREFRTLASLRHPNIVSVFDYGFEAPESPFYTMELLAGSESFLRCCRASDLTKQVTLLLDVLQALHYLHRRGVLHRDLKPANVLISGGRVVVLDFGLSVLRSMTPRGSAELSGTLHYMAPELLLGQPASEASDLYAFGVMAAQVLTGKRPFDADHSELLISRVLHAEPSLGDASLPEPLRQVLAQLVERDPKARLADATLAARALAQAAGLPVPEENAQVRESYLQAAAFVGREAELTTLRSVLNQAMHGHGALWLVGGESGVGKSRLLDEVRTLALVRGAQVDRGQAVAQAGAPYQVFVEALRSAVLSVPLSPLSAGTLHSVLPDLPMLVGHDIDPPPELDVHAARTRLQSVLCDVLLRRSVPSVLILEDLHWADAESRELLLRLLPALPRHPLLILASYRDDESPQLPSQLPGARTLPLSRLSPHGTAALIESMLGTMDAQPGLVTWLREQTEGNPFFLVEILRALAEEAGSLTRIRSGVGQDVGLRGGLATVISRRLSRLPDWALPTVRQAAVAGRRIDLDLMRVLLREQAAPHGDDPGDTPGGVLLDRWLAACSDAAVLDVQAEHWQFAHDKLREGVLASLQLAEKQALHVQVADAIERSHPGSPEVAASLAFHREQGGQPARAFAPALLAGEASVQHGALRDAHSLLSQALRLEALAQPAPLARVRLRRLLGVTGLALGHSEEAMRVTEEGLQLVGLPLPHSGAQTALGLLRGAATQAAFRLQERLPIRGPLPAWLHPVLPTDLLREAQGLLATHAEVALYLFSDRRLLFCSLSLANLTEQLGDVQQQITSYSALAYTAALIPNERLLNLYLQKADALRRQHPGTLAEFKFLRIRGSIYISQGRFDEAESDLRHAEGIARAIGDTYSRLVALQQILWIHQFRGTLSPGDTPRHEQANEDLATFYQLARQEGHSQFAPRARVYMAGRWLPQGQPTALHNEVDAVLPQIRASRDLTFELHAVQLHARAAIALGQWETARADADVLLAIFAGSPILNYGVLPAAYGLVDVCFALWQGASPLLRAQRRAQLARALSVLSRLARHHALARPAWLRAQARLLRADGKSAAQAQALEQQASDLARSLGIP